MALTDVPQWCRWRRGRSPLLLVAPHGGRADTATARTAGTKVNDVHTADLTWALAQALDAAAIVNPVLDRNDLDLNRISQVTRDAPWFPALMEHLIGQLLATHPSVEVLFIHGWNVIQPKCDIGVGTHFESEADAASLTQLTASEHYVRGRLHALRTGCTAAGIHTTYGERYPASHRNNVLQLFRRDGSRSCLAAPHIAEWAAGGRLNAVQLELGVPLRWPGRLRDVFAQALITAFRNGNAATDGAPRSVVSTKDARSGTLTTERDPPPSTMLLAYDPRAAVGFMSGVAMQPNGAIGGRLLLFSHGQTMALFTGEDPSSRGTVVGGPRFETRGGATALSFAGPLLEVIDAAAYVRLEQAFMQSRLVEASLTLSFEPIHGDSYGRVRGTAHLAGVTHHIDTFGFRNVPIFLRRPGLAPTRCAVAAAFGQAIGLHAATTEEDTMSWALHGSTGTRTTQVRTRINEARAAESHAPAQLTLHSEHRQLLVTPLNHMRIHRPLPEGGSEMIFLGLARCAIDSHGDGYGLYEYVRPSAAASKRDGVVN